MPVTDDERIVAAQKRCIWQTASGCVSPRTRTSIHFNHVTYCGRKAGKDNLCREHRRILKETVIR